MDSKWLRDDVVEEKQLFFQIYYFPLLWGVTFDPNEFPLVPPDFPFPNLLREQFGSGLFIGQGSFPDCALAN